MPKAYSSGVVPASADSVWEVVRPFDGLPAWHPAIESSEITSGSAGEVGAVRRLTLGDGGVVVEEGPPSEVLTAPREERTQRFLKRVLDPLGE